MKTMRVMDTQETQTIFIIHMNRELEARYLHLEIGDEIEVQVKLDDDGVVVDAFMEGESLGSTWKTYSEMGVEVNLEDGE